jgi:hypothetical protein
MAEIKPKARTAIKAARAAEAKNLHVKRKG